MLQPGRVLPAVRLEAHDRQAADEKRLGIRSVAVELRQVLDVAGGRPSDFRSCARSKH
jgi:hypothetical protein